MKSNCPSVNLDGFTPERIEALIAIASSTLLALSVVLFLANPDLVKGDVIALNMACLLYRKEITDLITKDF